jgi:hypothetical protein
MATARIAASAVRSIARSTNARPTPIDRGATTPREARHRLIHRPGTSDFDSDSHAHDPHAAVKEEESYNAGQH